MSTFYDRIYKHKQSFRCRGTLIHPEAVMERYWEVLEEINKGINRELHEQTLEALLTNEMRVRFANRSQSLIQDTLASKWFMFMMWRRRCGKVPYLLNSIIADPVFYDSEGLPIGFRPPVFYIDCPQCGEVLDFRETRTTCKSCGCGVTNQEYREYWEGTDRKVCVRCEND
jgi:ribosomal protein L37E